MAQTWGIHNMYLMVAVLVGRETILLVALVFEHAHIRKAIESCKICKQQIDSK